jgi:hypothetical protein
VREEQAQENNVDTHTNTRDLNDLESDTRNISLGLAPARKLATKVSETTRRDQFNPAATYLRPKPEIRTSSFSSTKFKQPSLGTKAVTVATGERQYGDQRLKARRWPIRLTLLSVLDELDTDTLADSGVRLLGLDTDLLEDDTLGVGRSTGGRRTVSGTEGTLLVVLVGLCISKADQLVSSCYIGVRPGRFRHGIESEPCNC